MNLCPSRFRRGGVELLAGGGGPMQPLGVSLEPDQDQQVRTRLNSERI